MSSANSAVRAIPGKKGARKWGWVEIHWAAPRTGDVKKDFALDKYECPILNEYSIGPEGTQRAGAVDGMPEKYRKKALTEIYEEFSAAGAKAGINLHERLTNHAEKFVKNNGVICRDVTQWVIIEIQPLFALEKVFSDALPFLEVWGFLQPRGIGDREAMKRDNGWVTDDAPRAGWFHAQIEWNRDRRDKGNGFNKNFIPRMRVLSDPVDPTEWKRVECRVTSKDSKSVQRHPRQASYGKGKRILIRVPVKVSNVASLADMQRRDELIAFAQKKGLTPEQERRLLRFEVGSYLKVWVRNSAFPWDESEPPKDHPGSRCMVQMQALDKPEKHDNADFRNFITSNSCDVDSLEVDGFGKVSDYLNHPANPDSESLVPGYAVALSDKTYVATRLPKLEMLEKTRQLTPLLFEGEWTASDEQSFQKKGNDASMPQWDEASETTYKCGNDTFRPFSFRNHTWKRNRLVKNSEGKLDQREWVYVGLWPEELITAMESLPHFLAKESKKGGALSLITSAVLFAAVSAVVYRLMEGLKKGATVKSGGQTYSYKSGDSKKYKTVKKLLETIDLPEMAAIIGCYGLPEVKEGDGGKPPAQQILESYLAMRKEFQSKVSDGFSPSPDKILYHIYGTIESLIIGAVDGLTLKNGVPTQDAYNLTFGRTPKVKKEWKWFETDLQEITDGKISASALKGEYVRRIGGSPLQPPILSWMAWVVSFQMRCLASLSVDFAEVIKAGDSKKVMFEVSPSGEAGIFFDIGAVWSLATELGVAFNGSAKKKDDLGEDYPDHPFADTLSKLFEMVDLQLGAAAKFVLDGCFACSLDLNKAGKESGCFAIESKTGTTAKIEMPVTGKLSVLTKEFFKIECNLAQLSTSALYLYPNGVRISSDFGSWRGLNAPGKLMVFGLGTLDRFMHMNPPYEIVLGRQVESYIASIDLIPLHERNSGAKVSGYGVYIVTSSNKKIDIDLESAAYRQSGKYQFPDGATLLSRMALNVETLRTDGDLRALTKDILANDTEVELWCRMGDDRNRQRTLENKQRVTIRSPRVVSFRKVAGPPKPSLSDSVTYDMQVSNLEQKNFPLYLWPVENDAWGRTPILNVEGSKGCLKITPLDGRFGRYRFTVHLSNFADIRRGAEPPEIIDNTWEVSFRVTIDPAGEYPLLFAHGGNGEYSNQMLIAR